MRIAATTVLLVLAACAGAPSRTVSGAERIGDACAYAAPYAPPEGATRDVELVVDVTEFHVAQPRFVAVCMDDLAVLRVDGSELDTTGRAKRTVRVTPAVHRFHAVTASETTQRMGPHISFVVKGSHDLDAALASHVTMILGEVDAPERQDRPKIRWTEP